MTIRTKKVMKQSDMGFVFVETTSFLLRYLYWHGHFPFGLMILMQQFMIIFWPVDKNEVDKTLGKAGA